MRPAIFADAVIAASKGSDGHTLAQLFAIGGPVAASVLLEIGDARPHKITAALRKCTGYLASPWEEMCAQHLGSLYAFSLASSLAAYPPATPDAEGKTRADRLADAFDAYNAAVTAFLRHFATLTPGRWALPLLRILCLNLRWLAVQADEAALEAKEPRTENASQKVAAAVAGEATVARTSSVANKRLEECARQLNKAFTACIADRNADMDESRKWGTYEVVGMVFKTYFRLKSVSLCRNILRALNAAALPPLESFAKSQQVTFRYYVGVLAFLNEEYERAETELSAALAICHRSASTNQALILTYLIPVKLLQGKLPSEALFKGAVGDKLQAYRPFADALRRGDVKAFDAALARPDIEAWLVKRGTFIAIERAREATLRTLLKHICLALPDKPTRVAIKTIHTATTSDLIRLPYAYQDLEWILATLIYKGYIKGYIAHERGILVLSAKDPFPSLGSVPITTT